MKINEQHLGQDATPEQAERVAEALRGLGYDVEYAEVCDYTMAGLAEIDGADWDAALDYAWV